MKQIPLLQGKVLLIELPDNAEGYGIKDNKLGWYTCIGHYEETDDYEWDCSVIGLPPGTWQIVGLMPEVTERDIKPLVKYISDWGYINHGVKTQVKEMLLKTALESLESAIRAEGWYFENPFGDEPAEDDYSFFTDSNVTLKEAWQQAQSRVLCRERCLVLKRD